MLHTSFISNGGNNARGRTVPHPLHKKAPASRVTAGTQNDCVLHKFYAARWSIRLFTIDDALTSRTSIVPLKYSGCS